MASTVSASVLGLTSDEGLHLRGERRSLPSQVDFHHGVYHKIGSRQRQSSIIYFPIIYLLAYYYLSSISLSSLYHLSHPSVYHLYLPTSLSLPFFSPFHLSWLSQSPITGCCQPLSIFCQYGSPAYRLWSRTCHLPSSTCASSFSLPVILSQPFVMKMRSLWTVHLVTSCFPSTVLPNGPPTPSLHCLCRVRGHLFSQLSPGCWGFPHRFPIFMKDTAMGLPVSHL